MGFQTLAIEQRAVEVWKVLGAVRTEFSKFGDVLDKVKKQLGTAANTIDAANVRTRAMERKLRVVECLPEEEACEVLEISGFEATILSAGESAEFALEALDEAEDDSEA